ncbi:hypothetical protein COOONC_28192 [Cooperia oncophora]
MYSQRVFKRSLLFEQFRDGTKKGTLIGDDSYQHDFFLITPSHIFKPRMPDGEQVNALGRAHKIVVTAIKQLKRQFPVLDGVIR